MFKGISQFGKGILSHLPHGIQQTYYHYRTSKVPLRKFLKYSEEAEILSLLPFNPQTFVDIGANHGDWTWGFLQILGKDATFYLFEPTPILYEELKQKFARYPNIHISDIAVSDKQGNADFFIADSDMLSSLEQLDTVAYTPTTVNTTLTTVKTNTLDNIYMNILEGKKIDLLKIDTQGHEEVIIKASKEALQATKALLVEWSIIPIYQNGVDFISLHQQLVDKGFRLSQIFNRPRHNYELTWADALYINESLLNSTMSS